MSTWHDRIVDEMTRAAPETPEHVARAAVAWMPAYSELCRSYGPAFMIAYSLRRAINDGVLIVADARVIEGEDNA